MLRTVLISAVMLFVGGCAVATPFTPTTMQGAENESVQWDNNPVVDYPH